MAPIEKGKEAFPGLPKKARDFSQRSVLRRIMSGEENELYKEIGKKNWEDLVKPLREMIGGDKEYALYLHENITSDGRTINVNVLTHEEWLRLKKDREDKIETLTARIIFKESSEDPQANTGDRLAYGE